MNEPDEYPLINSKLPDFESMLYTRASKSSGINTAPKTVIDPYKMMVNKKENESLPINTSEEVVQWPENDLKLLKDYCQKMGIVGFSCGKMHPIAALAMLRQRLGDCYTNTPMNERIPIGYQKMGTLEHIPHNQYQKNTTNKQILHG